ncbi:MAG: MBL fold metallo-hydrolase [candidate division WOR-3 bacterium]|nr:MBL fold metallo-hydrolase [candidate division WOR-3 bacterium]
MSRKVQEQQVDEIIFLGTGGARYVIAKQLRATGGIFFRLGGKNILVDPGPESYLRFLTYLPKFNPEKIDMVILTHKHIDHSADVNVYLDVITEGGFKKNGFLVAPADAFGKGGVVFEYLLEFLKEIKVIKAGLDIELDGLKVKFPIRHEHRVETYGFKISHDNYSISYIVDTKFFPELIDAYRADIVILSLLKLEPSDIDHLSVSDCENIIAGIKPKVAIITHFGMTIIRKGPWNIARALRTKTGVTVLAAEDGKHYEIKKLLSSG